MYNFKSNSLLEREIFALTKFCILAGTAQVNTDQNVTTNATTPVAPTIVNVPRQPTPPRPRPCITPASVSLFISKFNVELSILVLFQIKLY